MLNKMSDNFFLIMHVYWKINQPFEGLPGFGQLGKFLPENKSFNAKTVGLHVRRPVNTFHIEVEGLQNYKIVCKTHFKANSYPLYGYHK